MAEQEMTQQGPTPGDGASEATIADVRFEHLRYAFGIGEARPRLSWIVDTATAGWRQSGYEIEVYRPEGQLHDQTGRIESSAKTMSGMRRTARKFSC